MSTASEDEAERLGKRVSAVAKLVKTYVDNGVADFRTLVTRIAECHPEKFDAMKPYLSDVWNVAARSQKLKRISDVEADHIYDSIENHFSEKYTFQSDCLYEIEDKLENHRERLEEWKRKHPQAIKNKEMNTSLSKSVIIAAIIIAVAIVLAAFISRSDSGAAQWRSIGTNRIFNTQTGEVKWADPPEDKR